MRFLRQLSKHPHYYFVALAMTVLVVVSIVGSFIWRSHNRQEPGDTAYISQSTPTKVEASAPSSVEEAFPYAQQLNLEDTHIDGALSYRLTVQPDYIDTQYNDAINAYNAQQKQAEQETGIHPPSIKPSNPFAGQGIPGAPAEPDSSQASDSSLGTTTFTLATFTFTNVSGRTACEAVSTQCPDGGEKFNFGCLFTDRGVAARGRGNSGMSKDIVFNPDSLGNLHGLHPTYPYNTSFDKGAVIPRGETYVVTIVVSNDCAAIGNATGTVYWKL